MNSKWLFFLIFPEPTQVQLHGGKNPIVLHQEMNFVKLQFELHISIEPAAASCNGSTGQVPLPEHETFLRNTSYMNSEDIKMKGNSPKGFDSTTLYDCVDTQENHIKSQGNTDTDTDTDTHIHTVRWVLLNNPSCLMHRLHIVILHPLVTLALE